ncbi:FAD-dependent oxidoreductase, partial [Streptomyces exfoliatus]
MEDTYGDAHKVTHHTDTYEEAREDAREDAHEDAHEDVYDVVVIGGGPGGEVVADRIVRSGLTAVVVEAEAVGGECSYRACVPSKALLRPGAAREAALSVDGARQAVTAALDPAQGQAGSGLVARGFDAAGEEPVFLGRTDVERGS